MSDQNQQKSIVLLYKYVEVGGVATYLKTLAKVCIQHHYKVYLITAIDDDNRVFLNSLAAMGLHILPVSNTKNNVLLGARLWNVLKRNYRKHFFDVMHSHHRLTHVLGKLFSHVHNVPLLLSVHEFKYNQVTFTKFWRNEHITVPSKALKEHLVEMYNANAETIYVIPNAIAEHVELDEHRLKTLKQTIFKDRRILYVGYLGRLAYEKGTDILLESMEIVHRKNPDIAFRIFGKGPLGDELRKRCEELGLEYEIIFPGLSTDVNEILSLLDICVSPSRTESFSIFALEAMRAGKPVIASRVGGIPEVVSDGQTGMLIEPESPQDLANAIVELAKDIEYRKRLGEKAQNIFKERFSIFQFFGEHQKLYKQLMKPGNG